jgi:uncharacterized protein YegP (UPF0339 family)
MKKRYTLLYYKGEDDLWYWRLLASNKRIIADGSEGYSSKSNILRAIKKIKCLDFEYILIRELVVEETPDTDDSLFKKYFNI